MAFTKASLDRRKEAIKRKSAERDLYRKGPQSYEDAMPATMDFEPRGIALPLAALDSVGRMGPNATNITRVEQQNLRDSLMAQKAQEEMERAVAFAQRSQQPIRLNQKTPGEVTRVVGGVRGIQRPRQPNRPRGQRTAPAGTVRNFGKKRWGPDGIPETSDIKNKNPWEGKFGKLTTVQWRGRSFTVNAKVAPIFVALLDDIWATGYRPKVIGGYVDRNIAGTSTKSLHSYGYAIDIDPDRNPIYYNSPNHQPHGLPPNIKALAAKYGLKWGGNWRNTKDYMHFSMGYQGRE